MDRFRLNPPLLFMNMEPASSQPSSAGSADITRRKFMAQAGTAGAGVSLAPVLLSNTAMSQDASQNAAALLPEGETVPVKFMVNGKEHTLKLDPRVTLLDALRERLRLTGSKKGCDHGQCGACTVLVNGRRINSCLSLAVLHEDDEITSIEGLANGNELHPLQVAFIKCDGFQCGYCTPGQILSAAALLKEGCPKSEEGVRELMSGNLCRCGAYNGILEAVCMVRDQTVK